ncbi:hypothetical protein J6590_076987 [Homalodisca vitripennis]|nr:hypothetical protein J6590_076987 [Homalodisca vitripennis]
MKIRDKVADITLPCGMPDLTDSLLPPGEEATEPAQGYTPHSYRPQPITIGA